MDASLRAMKSPVPSLSCKPLEASSYDPVRSPGAGLSSLWLLVDSEILLATP